MICDNDTNKGMTSTGFLVYPPELLDDVELSAWLATVFYSAFVSLAPTRSIYQCFRLPGSFSEHRQAAPKRHEYVSLSLHRASPSRTREARLREMSPAVPACPHWMMRSSSCRL
ncbi:uncharacterized protein LOC135100155 [Scylla paramamosain]|uniref:uncharacterized protein LOC135100155 n=1 Tax=Scylla paramamosain TaxID=85552 RepID=UPI00308330D8